MKRINQSLYPQKLSRLNFFSRLEVAELPNLLMPGEQVLGVLSGFYSSGTAILCVTSKRLLLIDKKWVRLNFEDARFESINEVNYSHQAITASVKFYMAGRELQFKSWYKRELRILAQFVQNKMFEARAAQNNKAELGQEDQQLQQQFQPATLGSSFVPTQLVAPAATEERYVYPSAQMEQYLTDRIARWRRASRFVDTLPKTPATVSPLGAQFKEG